MQLNKKYLTSLGSYLVWSILFWVAFNSVTGTPLTVRSGIALVLFSAVFHKAFVWKKSDGPKQ